MHACREVTFRLLELVRKFKDGTGTETDLDTIEDLASTMIDASLCDLARPSPIPLSPRSSISAINSSKGGTTNGESNYRRNRR
jgi:NADH:ubiquinone oxidoreductase subunit F (NADH-binding)